MASYRATNLKFQGYQGHIMLMKVRYGYGNQSHIEKMGILESWYSDLRAILPVIWEKKPEEYTSVIRWGGKTVQDLMVDADARLLYAMNMYRPTFEGEDSCDPLEKEFMIYLRGILYLLDEITAISKIIDKVSSYEDGEELIGG